MKKDKLLTLIISFLGGIILGFLVSPVKNGINIRWQNKLGEFPTKGFCLELGKGLPKKIFKNK